MTEFYMIAGFLLAAYSVVANDSIQTLGTFLSSNSHRPWWTLWLFASGILSVVLIVGWTQYQGDVSYGRLQVIPEPPVFSWIYCVAPLVLLVLTRTGVPVSTTFLILTVFSAKALGPMLIKSLAGYVASFVTAILIYRWVVIKWEKRFAARGAKKASPKWMVFQWMSTGYLWSMWLIQDLANIFVYLQRQLTFIHLLLALLALVGFQAIVFRSHGGAIQKIVSSKTNSSEIRSATIIDFIYATILLVFKEASHFPMSTTWAFLGLLAGRELGLTLAMQHRSKKEVGKIIGSDASRAFLGLAVSVVLALCLPWLQRQLN